MPAFDVVRRWKGRVALDRDGHRIGSVVDVYYDAETDEPGWALLDLEQADGKTSLVPLGEANELAVGIQLPFELATVQRAPGMPAGGPLPARAQTASSLGNSTSNAGPPREGPASGKVPSRDSELAHARVERRADSLPLARDLLPVVRLGRHVEHRRRQGVADAQQPKLHREEAHLVVAVLVEPVEHGAVLLADLGGDPDHGGHFEAGGEGDHLAEVDVVGRLELVGDGHPAALVRLGQDVHGEGADRDVAADLAQAADAELLGEPVQVPRQPAGEPVAVALEDGPDVDFLEIGELHRASAEAARRPLEVDLRPAATSVGDRGAAARAFAGGRAV